MSSEDGSGRVNGIQSLLAATRRGLGPGKGFVAPQVSVSEADAAATPLAAVGNALGSVKVVMATGLYKTAAGVVGQRVIKENTEALRQYLTIQLRDAVASERALAAIEDAVEHGRAEELSKGPTKRAGLFLSAKNLVEYERLFGPATETPLHEVPWAPTRPGRPDGWGRALDEVRFSLGAAESEILELRFGCGLEVKELAYVLGMPRADVERRIEAGTAYAKLLVEGVLGRAKLEDVLREAFEVEPPTAAQIAAAKPPVVPLPAGTVIGDRYEVESLLGGGEFAFVYRARDVRVPGHVVALKLLHRLARTAAAREGALRELSLIASAFHPALVQFKDHGWFEDRLWFVMPFYEGEMLLTRLERGPLPVDEALEHFEKLARALAALHAAGIRHQDIKPENIFLVSLRAGGEDTTPEVLPVLLDLGVASPSGEMALAGTPMYFPPEIAKRIFDEECELPLNSKADVFALALSLLHSIETASLDLGEGESGAFDVDAFLRLRAEACPEGPRSRALRFLKKPFERWLAFHPNERPTAGELADEIAAVRQRHLGGGRARGASRAVVLPNGMRRAVALLGAAGVLLATTLLVDAPSRPLAVSFGGGAASRTLPAPPAGDAQRLLQRRLEAEEARGRALEEELARLRRLELGLSDDGEHLAATEREGDDAPRPPAP